MPWPTSPEIDDTYQPDEGGPTYVYRGNGRWDIQLQPSVATLSGYYTKAEIDAFNAGAAAALSVAIAALTAVYVPLAQRAAANGVATLNGSGKVPTDQLALAKGDVGLGNVDNTSDANKPISSATQSALDGKAPSGHGHAISDITDLVAALAAKLASSSYTASDVRLKLLTVDGPDSGINADLLDNLHASSFVRTINSSGPDGAGNVLVTLAALGGVDNVRLGSATTTSPTSGSLGAVPTGCVVTGLEIGSTGGETPVPTYALTYRPIQYRINGSWTTAAHA